MTEGEQVIHELAVVAAIRSTLVAWRPTPVAAARLAGSGSGPQPASGIAS